MFAAAIVSAQPAASTSSNSPSAADSATTSVYAFGSGIQAYLITSSNVAGLLSWVVSFVIHASV